MTTARTTAAKPATGMRIRIGSFAGAASATYLRDRAIDRVLDGTARCLSLLMAPWTRRAAIGTALCYGAILVAPELGIGAATRAANAATVLKGGTEHKRVRLDDGRDLGRLLLAAGAMPKEVDTVLAEIAGTVPLASIQKGTYVNVVLRELPVAGMTRIIDEVSFKAGPLLSVAVTRDGGRLMARDAHIAVDRTPLRLSGIVSGDIFSSLLASGLTPDEVTEYVSAVSAHVHPTGIVTGDRYDLVVEQERTSSGDRRTGRVLYAGLYLHDGQTFHLSQWTQDGKLRWFDAAEVTNPTNGIQRPVPGIVSSDFGMRHHPILGYTRMHKGMDFRAGFGTPILAVQTGWVQGAGWVNGYGQQVQLSHGAGLSTTYSHMSAMTVHRGELVHQGQVIGYVGATGLATGPHLHFELHQNGYAINPASVQFTMQAQLRGAELAGYRSRLRALLGVPVTGSGIAMTKAKGFG